METTETARTQAATAWTEAALEGRLSGSARAWLESATAELAAGAGADRFCALLSAASRHARAVALKPSPTELDAAARAVPGWNPERWTLLMLVRARLILALADLAGEGGARAVEEAFRFADEGEACALYASLCLLPGAERFAGRAAEGCRTNMLTVFQAVACDTPYPAAVFDDVAWNQCLIKCIFAGAPLWRVHGLDERLGPELARMALDLADERRSAGRDVQPDLWLCLGEHGGERGLASLERELEGGHRAGRAAAGYGLVRAGHGERLEARLGRERDPKVRRHHERALTGATDPSVFGELALLETS